MIPAIMHLKPLDLVESQARLDALPGSKHNVFDENVWQFKNGRGKLIRLDFNDLVGIGKKYPGWSLAKTVDLESLTKRIWLSVARRSTANGYVSSHFGVKLFWAAMAHLNLSQLSRDQLYKVLAFLLMHGWRQGEASKNPEIKSLANFTDTIKLLQWKRTFFELGLNLIAPDVTETSVKKQLQVLIPELTDGELTYRDWCQGGSLNRLTLDQGRYYVEHSLEFFERNYPLAIALDSTFKSAPNLAVSLGCTLRSLNQVLSLILEGRTDEDLKLQKTTTLSYLTLSRIRKKVTWHFQAAYRKSRFEAELLKEGTLESFLTACGLKHTHENVDRMRITIWDWLRRKDKQETSRLLSECQIRVPWLVFEEQLDAIKNRCDLLPIPTLSVELYQELGLKRLINNGNDPAYARQLIRQVSKAGLTNVVALTGWRASEFGFPMSAIKRLRNSDRLDQYAFPWRYQVDWYVYKTSGKVRELREITFNIFLIAERLQSLDCMDDELPCLYAVSDVNKNPFNSEQRVKKAVISLWGHFVNHYSGFKQLDEWTAWQALDKASEIGRPLTDSEHQELERLMAKRTSEEWASLSIDTNLKGVWRRVREEWPRIQFLLSPANSRDKKGWLVRYCNGTLRPDWAALLDAYLPGHIKDWLSSLDVGVLREVTVTKIVMSSFAEGTLYPSPHAFRHMWAEAVYRRFDGDAGWMIRSQFKHVSKAMWLAYIRDKDNRFKHERAKNEVISSLVHNYLRKKGEGYAGQLHTWLRRLFNKTSVLSPQEQENLADQLAAIEIEDLKANPWGYCLLKRRTRNKAKCAEMGEPMRHNASPDLCLGCIHNLMQTENIEWALFHAATHVGALRNPVVPAIFKASSYDLVKNVTRHVRTLNPQHEALTELQGVLDDYRASRAA